MQVGTCLRGFHTAPSLQQPLPLPSVTALTSQLLQQFSALAEGVLYLLGGTERRGYPCRAWTADPTRQSQVRAIASVLQR